MAERPPLPDLRRWTQARVGLGRIGQALSTMALLDFQLAHARARDAVLAELDSASLSAAIDGWEVIEVGSRAQDQQTYLQRPDLGRLLDEADEAQLQPGRYDAALIIADGLSATAVHRHAVPLLDAIVKRLPGWTLAPIVIARHARVALGDEIGTALGADLALVLIGERPGLSAPDSLGAYLTWAPRRGRLDSERNCVSNIRPPHGLSHERAADRIAALMKQARLRRLTGVGLKAEEALPPPL
jgi:ethanolamine ammonia-lyase small subunit